MDDSDMKRLMEEKYREVYSVELGRYVFVMRSWVEKSVFKRHKTLFGYTDIGWTVKHPKQLIRALVVEEVWKLIPGDDPNSDKKFVEKSHKDQERDDEGYEGLLEDVWEIREQSGK